MFNFNLKFLAVIAALSPTTVFSSVTVINTCLVVFGSSLTDKVTGNNPALVVWLIASNPLETTTVPFPELSLRTALAFVSSINLVLV